MSPLDRPRPRAPPTLATAISFALLLATPAIVAAGPYAANGTIGVADAPFVQMRLDLWEFPTDIGDVIDATLSWADADASLALEVVPPQFRCSNEKCVTDLPAYIACESLDSAPFAGTTRHVSIGATEAGIARIFVSAEFSDTPVPYTLSFAMNGEAPAGVQFFDERTTTPHRQHLCRAENLG